MTFGTFIEPDRSLAGCADPAEKLGCPIKSGYRAMDHARHLLGQSRIFDAIWSRSQEIALAYEDQCSSQYYFDVVRALRDFNGEFDHVVEVGAFMGGSSSVLAGCMERFDFTLDLIDIHTHRLHFSHERVRRLYPDHAAHVRLFHGDLPSYVRNVMQVEAPRRSIVHHDGAHAFPTVVKDLASLYYVREQLVAIIAQDTHLRSPIDGLCFVDMALYAVFGTDLNGAAIGTVYGEDDPICRPNQYEGNYFVPGKPEGIVLPMAMNNFLYPHPALPMEAILPPALETAKAVRAA